MRACEDDTLHKKISLETPRGECKVSLIPSPFEIGRQRTHTQTATDHLKSISLKQVVVLCERQNMRPKQEDFKRTSPLNCWVSLNTFKWKNGECHNKGISRLGPAKGWVNFPLPFLFIFWFVNQIDKQLYYKLRENLTMIETPPFSHNTKKSVFVIIKHIGPRQYET